MEKELLRAEMIIEGRPSVEQGGLPGAVIINRELEKPSMTEATRSQAKAYISHKKIM